MTETILTEREQEAWADLYILVPALSFTTQDYLLVYYSKDTFTDTAHVILRRILREIGHKIVRWESYIDVRNGYTSRDTLTIDIKKEDFVAKAEKYGNLALCIIEEVEELSVNRDRSNSSPSSDGSLSPPPSDEEDEPSLPSVASVD
jgi:hypothetical protein